jgi:hypothetical protein
LESLEKDIEAARPHSRRTKGVSQVLRVDCGGALNEYQAPARAHEASVLVGTDDLGSVHLQ